MMKDSKPDGRIVEFEGKEYFMPTSSGPAINAGSISVSEIPESKLNSGNVSECWNSGGLSPLFARDIENMNEDDLITVFDRVTAELEKRSSQSKVIAQAEHEIESRTSEPAISTHLGILYDSGMLKLPEGD